MVNLNRRLLNSAFFILFQDNMQIGQESMRNKLTDVGVPKRKEAIMTFGAVEIPAVLGALGSAGGLAGIAGGGAKAPLMQLDTISEQGTCCNFICFSPNTSLNVDNKKVTYNGSSFQPEKKASPIAKIFKKICCFGDKESSKKEKIEDFYANYQYWLVQNYGRMAAFAAPQYAGIDWNNKVHHLELLTVEEVKQINQKAAKVAKYEPLIREWMRHLHYLNTIQHMDSSNKDKNFNGYSQTKTIELKKTVKHPDGTKEKFKLKKLKKSIRKAPTKEKICKNDVEKIAFRVSTLFASDEKSIPSMDLIEASAREIAKEGYEFKDALLSRNLERNSLTIRICAKKDASELTPEECCSLIEFAKKTKKQVRTERESTSSTSSKFKKSRTKMPLQKTAFFEHSNSNSIPSNLRKEKKTTDKEKKVRFTISKNEIT